jgi:hypothetical protein
LLDVIEIKRELVPDKRRRTPPPKGTKTAKPKEYSKQQSKSLMSPIPVNHERNVKDVKLVQDPTGEFKEEGTRLFCENKVNYFLTYQILPGSLHPFMSVELDYTITRLRWLVVNKGEFPRQELSCEKALDRVEKQPAK